MVLWCCGVIRLKEVCIIVFIYKETGNIGS